MSIEIIDEIQLLADDFCFVIPRAGTCKRNDYLLVLKVNGLTIAFPFISFIKSIHKKTSNW